MAFRPIRLRACDTVAKKQLDLCAVKSQKGENRIWQRSSGSIS
ncbi:hypothetical protein SAMCFNEI73_pC1191 (plasmid) [Sinorhizobium americanum]|uniref:Uncharacterized protein n=1 Tax=Sinorhizobium americanum TaxID=194963 RepID=A0A1L3LXS4_9HYPH|nr:hypothetical protein SAMCFNEI73_pC1191 [Sinorhizobium americanum]